MCVFNAARRCEREFDSGACKCRIDQVRLLVGGGRQDEVVRAAKTLRHIEWFEVGEIRGRVQDGKVTQYQVSLKVGFRVET